MDISYKWLKRFIDVKEAPVELAATLTSLGLECDSVEEVESIRGGLRGVVIGKVLTCEDHPDSDHLHVTTVDLGQGEPVQIVCGAPNVAAGQTVVVATVGTTLYDGDKEFQIKKSKIRGKESFGMICAEDEIGLGASHDGIMVLAEEVAPGTPAAQYFKVESDYRLEVELTPNRVDAASHLGVARDYKARQWSLIKSGQIEGEYPKVTPPSIAHFEIDRHEGGTKIRIEDPQGCPRYTGVTIRGVKVAESPEWLKNLLISAGQRPINNIVDITNFVLLGIGQPLHSFDLAKVKDEEIVVRTCPAGTKFTTLDGVERTLHEADLMICDAEKPLCIAGVFGGLESGVTEATTDIFIESAYFNPTRVRRTARRHGLSTDASFRYERGADPSITPYAARLAAVMIKELAGGEICGPVEDIYPSPILPAQIDFSLSYCNRLIGKEIPAELVKCILEALEIKVEETADADVLHLTVPTYRVDVTRPCDVVEEVLRVYGYNNIEIDSRMSLSLSQRGATDDSYSMQQTVSEQLTAQGFSEIMNNSLTSVAYYEGSEQYPLDACVKLMNPLSSDLGVMRQTLLYGGLESVAHNVNRRMPDLKLYEFGNVYTFDASKEATEAKPLVNFSERPMLGIWMTGKKEAASWNVKSEEASIYDLAGIVLNIFRRLGLPAGAYTQSQSSDETMAAKLVFTARSGKVIAEIGTVRGAVLKKFGIEQPVYFASIEWETLFKLTVKNRVFYQELPKTQEVERDLALLVDKSMKFEAIEAAIRKAERKLLQSVTLFDVYEGKNLPAGKKSYAVGLKLQDMDKTLNDKQIDNTMNRIIEALKQIGAELR